VARGSISSRACTTRRGSDTFSDQCERASWRAEARPVFGRASKKIRPSVSRRVNCFSPRVRRGSRIVVFSSLKYTDTSLFLWNPCHTRLAQTVVGSTRLDPTLLASRRVSPALYASNVYECIMSCAYSGVRVGGDLVFRPHPRRVVCKTIQIFYLCRNVRCILWCNIGA